MQQTRVLTRVLLTARAYPIYVFFNKHIYKLAIADKLLLHHYSLTEHH